MGRQSDRYVRVARDKRNYLTAPSKPRRVVDVPVQRLQIAEHVAATHLSVSCAVPSKKKSAKASKS